MVQFQFQHQIALPTLLAGRSITNQNITTNNGNLALRANTDSALGTVDAQRDSGRCHK